MHKIIQELNSDNSRLAKEAILKREALAGNTVFFEGCRLALDPLITFGVKKVPKHSGPDGQGLPWPAFNVLAEQLYQRNLTGNDAREAIELALAVATKDEWNLWYRGILQKNLRCGVSEKTVNKCVKGTKIPPIAIFTCQLAHKSEDHEKKMTGKKLLDFKYDGVRVLTILDKESNTVTMFTREGRALKNFSHISDALQNHIQKFSTSVVFDGEMISKSFQKLMTQVNRKTDVDTSDAVLMLFDVIPLFEFRKGKGSVPQKKRMENLKNIATFLKSIGPIEVIDQIEVDLDEWVGQAKLEEFNTIAKEKGLEGIMIKDPDAVYECKRTVAWLKKKPTITVDLAIVDVKEGNPDTKYVGKLGALICEGTDQGKFIRVDVGGKLSDEQRDELWADKDNIIGQVVEVEADAITQSEDSIDTYSLRFPRLKRFRGITVGEKM